MPAQSPPGEGQPVIGSFGDPEIFRTLDLALRIGELLLSSGAGAADVRAQMDNVAYACGLRGYSVDVTFTELAMSHQSTPEQPALIQIRNVRHREVDYEDLTLVDHLVRDLVVGRIDRDQAATRLNRIVSSGHARPKWAVTLGLGAMGGGVGLVLGGDLVVVLIAFIAVVGVDLLQRRMTRNRIPTFYQQVAGGLLATLLAVGVDAVGLPVARSTVITAGIILLLAGVSFLGAIQDALTGFPLTAGARILEAIIATAGVIGGVSGGLQLARVVGLPLGTLDPGVITYGDVALMGLGGAITAAAYAYSSYAPYRALLPVAVIGAAAVLVYRLMFDRGFGVAWASGVAALVVGLVSFSVAGRARVPALVVVTAAIVPLLPGLSIYRGLALLSDGGSTGLLAMVTAAAIAIALSSGVILGEYIAQPLKREARKLETRLAGPRLVGPLTARASSPTRRRRSRRTSP
ncbi:threonine/serine exporter family protein [Nocardioides mangrovicus]|uniref:Threonine/serine exporter family protein n=1 Tax=Nocardioides mangrovicus TaxID=2478913 RepID=A0A3L8NY79_9ACTN|nr:threonine/serine exporter family protein [Nocardioides mangrovicus]RLV47884.1 threonine/serine exporter family protein [Nocardioides mangrovicus]